jgi:hypothetical protein
VDLIEGMPVDRERARKNLNAGLLAAALAVFTFGLTFYAAIVYIG